MYGRAVDSGPGRNGRGPGEACLTAQVAYLCTGRLGRPRQPATPPALGGRLGVRLVPGGRRPPGPGDVGQLEVEVEP